MARKPWMRDGEDWRSYQDRLNLWEQGERLIAEQKRSNSLAKGQMVNQQKNVNIDVNVLDNNFILLANKIDQLRDDVAGLQADTESLKTEQNLLEADLRFWSGTTLKRISDFDKLLKPITNYLVENDPERFGQIVKQYYDHYHPDGEIGRGNIDAWNDSYADKLKQAHFEAMLKRDEAEDEEFGDAESDPLYDQAVEIVLKNKRASISLVQRHLRIGYNRAARLVEQMESAGLVSSMSSSGSREILPPNSDS